MGNQQPSTLGDEGEGSETTENFSLWDITPLRKFYVYIIVRNE